MSVEEEKIEPSDVEVYIGIPLKSREQLQYILEAEKLLEKAGITFDTGTGFGFRDWQFDWSLSGAVVYKIRDKKDNEVEE